MIKYFLNNPGVQRETVIVKIKIIKNSLIDLYSGDFKIESFFISGCLSEN